MAPEFGHRSSKRPSPRQSRSQTRGPLPLAERLGRVWAGIFLGIVVLLAVVLVGKALLSKGG